MGRIKAKERMQESLFNVTSKAISDFDKKTEELVKQIHKTREEQVTKNYVAN